MNKLSGSRLDLGGGGEGLCCRWLAEGSLVKLRLAGWTGGGIIEVLSTAVDGNVWPWEMGCCKDRAAEGPLEVPMDGVTEGPRYSPIVMSVKSHCIPYSV